MIPKEFREIFCNDFKLPIKIYDSPLFEYYCETYEADLGIKAKMAIFEESLKSFKTFEDFKEEWHRIKNGIIKDIESTESFKKLSSENSNYQTPFKVERGNPYNHTFKNEECLSIDLKSANFNSLRFYHPETVLGATTFAELVKRYSTIPYYEHVKIFRQVIFEKLNPNKQQTLQRKMMDTVLAKLFEIKPDLYVRMPSNDEIIVPLWKDQKHVKDQVLEVVKNHDLSSILTLEEFKVKHIFDDLFYKEYPNGKIQLRNVPSQHYPRAYKLAKGLAVEDNDLYFVYEGKKAKFQE